MEAIFLLIAVSLVVAIAFLFGFIWAVKSKQYEDDFSPSVRILFEEKATIEQEEPSNQKQ